MTNHQVSRTCLESKHSSSRIRVQSHESIMRKFGVSVMCSNQARSFPFDEEVPETILKTVSTKLSDFPHRTTYHTMT